MNRLAYFILCLVYLTWPSLGYSASNSKPQSGPDWYQVEVIIFSQQDFYKSETPRRDITLSYPEHWIMLKDPSLEEQQESTEDEPEQPANGASSISQLSAVMHNQADLGATPIVIEEPFLQLPPEEQALNPDAYALKRSPGYRVLFHQAWRQPAISRKETPWILIKGGRQYGSHFELEGSLRIYQSRHLHLQTKLWKARYQLPTVATAPEVLKPEPGSLAGPELEPWPAIPDAPQPPPPEINHPDQLVIEYERRVPFASGDLPKEIRYEVTEVVSLNQSHRLTIAEMHYLDHPNMGALVLIKKYEAVAEEDSLE